MFYQIAWFKAHLNEQDFGRTCGRDLIRRDGRAGGYPEGMDGYEDQLEAALILQIRVEMVERDMHQKDLSEAAGLERATLNRYLKGHRSFPAPTLFKIAGSFQMTPSELLRRAEARVERPHSSVSA